MATELAKLRKVTVTKAVSDAIRNELERHSRRRARENLAANLVKIGQNCAAHIEQPLHSADHAELLYGSDGLPH